MISILIPIYNRDARMLVREIVKQSELLGIEFEVICFDNHSLFYRDKNIQIARFHNCQYTYLDESVSFHKVRNLLADQAKFDHLLFLDSDIKIDYYHFVKNYVQEIPHRELVCGGIHYLPWPPTHEYMLHWMYGIKLETKKSMNETTFLSCNFLIKKSLFEEIRFDENQKEFAHQDAIFGIELNKKGIVKKHIFSPITHNTLDHTDVFIDKIRDNMSDIARYLKQNKVTYTDAKGYRYVRLFLLLKKVQLSYSVSRVFKLLIPSIESNLRSRHPIMLFLRLYKIGFLCHYYYKNAPKLR